MPQCEEDREVTHAILSIFVNTLFLMNKCLEDKIVCIPIDIIFAY
jgi:hypothetical protein